MKSRSTIVGLILMIFLAGSSWAGAPASGTTKQQEGGAVVKAATPEQRRDYEKKTAQELAGIRQRLVDLKTKAVTGPAQKRRLGLMTTQRLEYQAIAAQNHLAQMEKMAAGEWEKARGNLDQLMQDLRQTLNAAEQQI